MKMKLIVSSIAIFLVTLGWSIWWLSPNKTSFHRTSFDHLPGWDAAKLKKPLLAFQTSCHAFIKQNPNQVVGTEQINLQVKDWQPACREALAINPVSEQSARHFFQHWFSPVEFYEGKPVKGLFTGYYMPLVKGSLTQSDEFNVPLYEVPTDLISVDLGLFSPVLKNQRIIGRLVGNKLLPYHTRAQITKGAIHDKARVLLWIHSPIDRLFLEIQGSGIIELNDGSRVYIGYDGQNGAPYTAIAGVLIKQGVMTKDNASMQAIKRYLEDHPEEMDQVINQNNSFIFFRKLAVNGALGSQGVALTPGYSLAVDKHWIPIGTPLWLTTSRPDVKSPDTNKSLQRLMIAQDTGGAIKGKVRGDVFWGDGDKATIIAGHMKNEGRYWLLLPTHALSRLQGTI